MRTIEIESNLKTTPKQRWENNKQAIITLHQLRATGKQPTREQLIKLASFNGWGSLSRVFNLNPTGWEAVAQQELKELLGEREYNNAAALTLNAYYTDPAIIRSIWDVIVKAGFKNGRVLEPACGTGLFFGGMKPHYLNKSELFGVEIDPTSAAIAQYLYPDAVIHNSPFEKVQFPDNYFDLIVSNVPFGSLGISDPSYDHLGLKIHNYFLAKCSDLVRVGGLIGIITSSYTLDAPGSQRFREWLSKKLKLITAFRLPNTAFKEVANTEVTTDFLLFQKVEAPTDKEDLPSIPNWIYSDKVIIEPQNWQIDGKGELSEAYLSNYYRKEFDGRKFDLQYQKLIDDKPNDERFAQFKEKIYTGAQQLIGAPSVNKLYGDGFALLSDGRDVLAAIDAIKIDKCYQPSNSKDKVIVIPPELQNVKDMAFCLHEGRVYQRQGSNLVKVKNVEIERIKSFWRLREATIECLNAQSTNDNLEPYQQRLKQEYESFIFTWGKVNEKRNTDKLDRDPNYYLIRGLEKPKSSTLADIFHKRVCSYNVAPTSASNIHDAISISLTNTGKFDISYASKLLNKSESEVIQLLEAETLAYFNPETQNWELKDAYLSGNVVEKLTLANQHLLARNVEALKRTLPLPMLPPTSSNIKFACIEALGIEWDTLSKHKQETILKKHINASIGAGWIDSKYYQQFALEVLKISTTIRKVDTANLSCWTVKGYSRDVIEYGTQHLNSLEIFRYTLNRQEPRVSLYDDEKKLDINASNKATEAARTKANLIKKAFADWIWSDKTRSIELCLHYNQHVNVYVDRQYDGSYLTFPGMNPAIKLKKHQRNAVARMIQTGATFLGHQVGFGKTYTLIAAIMECRRLKLVKRPILVALNGTEQQIYDDWKKLYPTANVLLLPNLNADNRKYFSAALASADFDGVILTHSQYFSLALSKEYQLEFLEKEKSILKDYLNSVKSDGDKGAAKQIQRTLRTIENRIYKVTNSERKDNHIDFEDLRIDLVAVDEVQMFKNLSVITKLFNIKGIQTTYSQRATDNYMKLLHVMNNAIKGIKNTGSKIFAATGTVINNSLCEIFTWIRTYAPQELEKLKASAFDKFMSYFGVISSGAEISASGQYKVMTRFKSFCNLQPLRALCKQFLDIANSHTHPEIADELQIPDEKYIDVVVPPSEAQLKFLRDAAVKRAKAIQDREVDPREDNFLKLTTDFNLWALSGRLGGEMKEALCSKLHQCAWNVWQIWKASQSTKRTQLIFCDYSTPKCDRYNVYDYMKLLLKALGIPESQIAFIHDYDAEERPKLYKLIEQGKVQVLIGSTSKLGTGCNVHKRGIVAMHHLDAPWRPSDLKQRDGRGVRQGNGDLLGEKVKAVLIFRYITEQLDALRWQVLAVKQEFIEKFFNGDEDEIENCEEVVYSYHQVMSIATGNPLLIEEANLRNELNMLLMQLSSHEQQQFSLSYEQRKWELWIPELQDKIARVKEDINNVDSVPEIFEYTQIEDNINAARKQALNEQPIYFVQLGKYRNFGIYGYYNTYKKEVEISLRGLAEYDFNTVIKGARVPFQVKHILNSIDELIALIPDYLSQLNAEIKSANIELSRCKSLVGKQFDEMDRISEIKQRLGDIEAILEEHEGAVYDMYSSEDEIKSESSSDNNESGDDDESKGVNKFWTMQDRSSGATTLEKEVVDMLLNQTHDNVDWLTEFIKNQSSTIAITIKTTDTATSSTIAQINSKPAAVSTKQLSLFEL
ncbi:hypothetical protein CAL7716_102320 (plasmid) [Calothrix sp. PCC 7716]|nr:hypothetical protein CAL7716_102320 [Calothrix sp. PCC 7716]